ncbi:MAG: DUF3011 domain-containing protein [Pseudomonadota bacterium]
MKKQLLLGMAVACLSFQSLAVTEKQQDGYDDAAIASFNSIVGCESWDFAPEICRIGQPLTNAILLQQHSSTSCSGKWFNLGEDLLVTDGCRATFVVSSSANKQVGSQTCSSIDFKYAECKIPTASAVWVSNKLSNSECKSGVSWGYKTDTSAIWVSDGCRATFNYIQ